MRGSTLRRPPTPRPVALLRTGSWILVLLAALALPAAADTCGTCGSVNAAAVRAEVNPPLPSRPGLAGFPVPDELEFDVGECEMQAGDVLWIRPNGGYLRLKATGEAWNCPHSKSSATIKAEASSEDRSSWTLSAGAKLGFGLLGAKVELAANGSKGGSKAIREATSYSTKVEAQPGRRVVFFAYLWVGNYLKQQRMDLSRMVAWWTKNDTTGGTVHAKGEWHQECGAIEPIFERRAPISWHLRTAQRACEGAAPYEDLGFFPPPPPPSGAGPTSPPLPWPLPGPSPWEVPLDDADDAPARPDGPHDPTRGPEDQPPAEAPEEIPGGAGDPTRPPADGPPEPTGPNEPWYPRGDVPEPVEPLPPPPTPPGTGPQAPDAPLPGEAPSEDDADDGWDHENPGGAAGPRPTGRGGNPGD